MSGQEEVVSHGRGGTGNIGKDNAKYVDGEIVRKGVEGDQGDGPFSTGRGGQGNVRGAKSPRTLPADADHVPDTATRLQKEHSHHFGRGGMGNEGHIHDTKGDQHGFDKSVHAHEGLADKLKHKISGHHNKEK